MVDGGAKDADCTGLADIVSFADKAREHGREISPEGTPAGGPTTTEVGGAPAASPELTRRAMARRLAELAPHGGERRPVDDELAKLVFDSSSDLSSSTLTAIRAPDSTGAATRQLTFESPDLLLEVQIDGRHRELTCQIVPPQPASLEIHHAGGAIDLGHDDFGTFFAMTMPPGAFSLRCVPASGRAAATSTSWLTP